MEAKVGWREEGVGWGWGAVNWRFTFLFSSPESSFLVDTFFIVDIFLATDDGLRLRVLWPRFYVDYD